MFRYDYFSAFCKSVGHPVRLAILDAIVAHNNCVEAAILEIPSVHPYTFAQHIRALKKAGLIRGSLVNSRNCYCVDWDKLEAFKEMFDELYSRVYEYKCKVESNNGKCIKQ